jgi:hypothetical protein
MTRRFPYRGKLYSALFVALAACGNTGRTSGGFGGSGGTSEAPPSCSGKTLCYDICTCIGRDPDTCLNSCQGGNSGGATGACAGKTTCYDVCTCTGTAPSTCLQNCQTSATCGNTTIEAGEVCDGPNLNGRTCDTATAGALPVGTLACSPTCTFDTSRCGGFGSGGGAGVAGSSGFGGVAGGTGAGGFGGTP